MKLSECRRCDLHLKRHKVVVGRGNSNHPAIIFIGEAPGEEEDKSGLPFVGRAGEILNKAITFLGISKEDWFVTNIVKCRPTDESGYNRPPTDKEKIKCEVWLTRQIAKMEPRILIPLGNHATQFLLEGHDKRKGITELAGRPYKIGDLIVFPLLHPASILHQNALKSQWESDLLKLRQFLEKKHLVKLKNEQASLKDWLVTADNTNEDGW